MIIVTARCHEMNDSTWKDVLSSSTLRVIAVTSLSAASRRGQGSQQGITQRRICRRSSGVASSVGAVVLES